jgi:hypothetical protein
MRRTFGQAGSYYLKTIEGTSQSLWLPHTRESQFFFDWGNRSPIRAFSACRTGLGPHPPTPLRRPVPLEPRRNYTGALRFQRPSQPLPLLPRSPVLTLTFRTCTFPYDFEGRSCGRLGRAPDCAALTAWSGSLHRAALSEMASVGQLEARARVVGNLLWPPLPLKRGKGMLAVVYTEPGVATDFATQLFGMGVAKGGDLGWDDRSERLP